MTAPAPTLPEDLRLYAIGDVHGRLDLLDLLLKKIVEDEKNGPSGAKKIFLGDYVDRGLYSRQVLDRLIDLKKKEKTPSVFLMGNHEHVMRDILREGREELLCDWLRFGGRETLLSYGVSSAAFTDDSQKLLTAFYEKIPNAHRDFLESLTLYTEFGDYFFCHAGVRPGIDLYAQNEQDLMWIRRDFLTHEKPFPRIIVHGHTISPEPEFMGNRINIDTGAYATGRLTALGLEGTRQWLIQTG